MAIQFQLHVIRTARCLNCTGFFLAFHECNTKCGTGIGKLKVLNVLEVLSILYSTVNLDLIGTFYYNSLARPCFILVL
jgi:hypothetical protein